MQRPSDDNPHSWTLLQMLRIYTPLTTAVEMDHHDANFVHRANVQLIRRYLFDGFSWSYYFLSTFYILDPARACSQVLETILCPGI